MENSRPISNETPPDELLAAWRAAQACGKTLTSWAAEMGVAEGTLDTWLNRARRFEKENSSGPIEKGVSDTTEGNAREVSSVSDTIKTLDDLLEACKVDTTVWSVDHYIINKWPIGRKLEKKALSISDGVASGTITDTGGFCVEALFQVKAWLIKKHPEPISLPVQPISINARLPRAKKTSGKTRGLKRALILPDVQCGFRKDNRTGQLDPFHDRAALDVALQIAQAHRFDRIVWLGDVLDLSEWTDRFIRSPDFYFTTQPALVELFWWLAQFRQAAPKTQIEIIEGNHELRLETSMMNHLAAAYNIHPANEACSLPAISVRRWLGLDALDIQWCGGYPNSEVWLNNSLRCTHGNVARTSPGDSAKAIINRSTVSVVFGHIHRLEQVSLTMLDRDGPAFITALSPGCLCRLDYIVPGHQRGQNWQQGLAVATYDDDKYNSVEAIRILDGMAIYAGEVYRARNRIRDLRKDTKWDF